LKSKDYRYIDKDKALDVLEKLSKIVDVSSCWINSGTLLGIYRDNDFIDWDTDIDVGVVSSLDKELFVLDYPILCTSKWENRVMQTVYDVDGVNVDLWYWWNDMEQDKIINVTNTGVWRMDKSIICPIDKYTWKDIEITVPNNIEEALLFQYSDWKIPRGFKNEWYLLANNLEGFETLKQFYEK
jgi:hypothetical protein